MSRSLPLGHVAEIIRGVSFGGSDAVPSERADYVAILRAGNISEQLQVHEDLIWVPKAKVKPSQFLRRGDIVICTSSGSPQIVGKTAILQEDWKGAVGAFCAVIRSKPNVSANFLAHFLRTHLFRKWTSNSSGANIKNIRVSELAEFKVPLPPLAEQKRIAAILDKADAIRRKREKAIELTDSFLRSVFLEMFEEPASQSAGWEVVQLGHLISFLTSGSRGWARYYSDQGDIFLRIQNVANGRLKLDDLTYVNAPASAEGNRTRVQEGDILLSITADLGRTAVIPIGFPTAYINQHLALLRVKGINPFFLSAFLSSPVGQRQIQRLNREGVKAGLNFDDIRSLKITLPPMQLQQKYYDIWNKQTSLLERNKQSLHRLDSLTSSLSAELFSQHGEQKERFSITAKLKEEVHAV